MSNDPFHTPARRHAAWLGLAVAAVSLWSQAGGLAIDEFALVPGGGRSQSAGGCFGLLAAIGQDTVGSSTGGAFTLRSGFWAGAGSVPGDRLFNDGFQECQ